MLVDWLTAFLPFESLRASDWERLKGMTDRVQRFCPQTGEVRWETSAWESVRSDSHQLAVHVGGQGIRIQGSPARCIGSGDAVFGEGSALGLDLKGCLRAMVRCLTSVIGVELPMMPHEWQVTRIDVTGNILLPDLQTVRTFLAHLRSCEGGRYRVSQQSGDTVYWSHKSKHKSGKAYAKGPHIRHMIKQKGYTGREYTESEINAADRLLRLELKLGCKYLKQQVEKNWWEITPQELANEWDGYFMKMVGSAEVSDDTSLKDRLRALGSEGQAKAALGCYLLIRSEGWEKARESYTRSSWYRHLKLLRDAGLGDMDIASGTVTPFRRKLVDVVLVNTWSELLKAA